MANDTFAVMPENPGAAYRKETAANNALELTVEHFNMLVKSRGISGDPILTNALNRIRQHNNIPVGTKSLPITDNWKEECVKKAEPFGAYIGQEDLENLYRHRDSNDGTLAIAVRDILNKLDERRN